MATIPEPAPLAPTAPQRRTFLRLVGFLSPYRWSLAASVVLAIGAQVSGLAIPALTGMVIDQALPGEDGRRLALLVGLIALAGLVKSVMLVGRRLIAGRQALGVEYDMRNALYSHLLRLSWRFYDRQDRKSTRLNSSHVVTSRMPSSA